MSGKILVTGATGNVGREVIRELLAMGQPVVAAVTGERSQAHLAAQQDVVPEARRFRFDAPASWEDAFTDVDRLFLMRPPHISDVRHTLLPVIDHAAAHGVRHCVFLSLLGAARNPAVPHYRVEQHLLAGDMATTLLRPSFFMQNLNTRHCAEIRDSDVIAVPVGRAKTSFVDVRDVGAVAATVLSEDGHRGHAYDLTGGKALDYYEVAAQFSQVLGRPITYTNPTLFAFMLRQRRQGVPFGLAMVMTALYTATRLGGAAQVTDTVWRLLGRPPINLRTYISDYAEAWQPKREAGR